MLRCWVARDRFELDTNMAAWARTVMRNGFLSDRRRDRFRADLPEDAFDRLLSVAPNQDDAVALTDLDWALGELPQDQRAAVLLAGEGISIEESAVRLCVPEGTIKSRISRGRERLRKLTDDRDTPLLTDKRAPLAAPDKPRERRDWSGVMIG
jgi:RNA polymerase sigma-70 factor (ECF subfamily)